MNNELREQKSIKMSWGKASMSAVKLILLDIFWSILSTTIALALVFVRMNFPTHMFCRELQTESKSHSNFNLPRLTLLVEILDASIYYTIPLITFNFLTNGTINQKKPLNLSQIISKRCFASIMFFVLLDVGYRIVMFLLFKNNNEQKVYPWWFSFPLNFNWVLSVIQLIRVLSIKWTHEYSNTLIVEYHIPEQVVQENGIRVRKSIQKNLTFCILLTTINGILVEHITPRISEKSNKKIMVILMLVSYPLWIYFDRMGRKLLPWSQQVIKNINKAYDVLVQESLSPYENFDPIARNGVVISTQLLVGLVISVRIIQANMNTLSSKITAGLLATCLQSIMVVIKPYLLTKVNKIFARMQKKIQPMDIVSNASIVHRQQERESFEQSNKRVYMWHRSHAIVIINRLEMFSIMFSHGVMILSARIKRKTTIEENFVGSGTECEFETEKNFGIALFILCFIESIIEFSTYTFLIKVEKLNIPKCVSRIGFQLCFLYFTTIVVAYLGYKYLIVGHVVLSCGQMDKSIYNYYCN